MASEQPRNKSISQLVHELNSLGNDSVLLHPTCLFAVQSQPCESVRRFRSKSVSRSRAQEGERVGEFYLVDGSQKKYHYGEIWGELETLHVGKIMSKYQQGFNTTIVAQGDNRVGELLAKVGPWVQDESQESFYASFIEYRAKDAVDLLGEDRQKTMTLSQASEGNLPFYEQTVASLLKIKNSGSEWIKVLRITSKSNPAELRVLLLPQSFLCPSPPEPSLKITKSQLCQIINYIKTNPNKKYQHISKLLPKRFPLTTVLAQILLYDSVNIVVNWLGGGSGSEALGRFEFYDKLAGISNLVRRVESRLGKLNISRSSRKKPASKSPKPVKQRQQNLQTVHTRSNFEPAETRSIRELQYCRSLQRKTHKYSVSQFDSPEAPPLFPQTIPLYPSLSPELNQAEALAVLQAQHARQVSQYHQTIQALNQKLLVLSSQSNFQQIFTIHEREIMVLELKIAELRGEIAKLCQGTSKNKEVQNLKEVVKRLNEQIATMQKTAPAYKLSQGKIKMLETQLQEWKDKCRKGQIARKQLQAELEAATNRLKIKDEETKKLLEIRQKQYKDEDLAAKQAQTLAEISELTKNSLNKDASAYLIRKVKNILGSVSELRETVLECNNFLVDLQQHIQSKLGQKDPDVVLDCNRFIRSYLLNNLDVF